MPMLQMKAVNVQDYDAKKQINKISEEMVELITEVQCGTVSSIAEECCDVIQSAYTLLHYLGTPRKHWSDHMKKMDSRKWKAREK